MPDDERGWPILTPLNGPVPADLMLIGEAPGRLGAARTGVPFCGDQSARNLVRLLEIAGWTREQVFLTNAVLCHPRSETGTNRRPDRAEIRRCSRWIEEQIVVVDPIVIGALGVVALEALGLIEPHDVELRRDAGRRSHGKAAYLCRCITRRRALRSTGRWQRKRPTSSRSGASRKRAHNVVALPGVRMRPPDRSRTRPTGLSYHSSVYRDLYATTSPAPIRGGFGSREARFFRTQSAARLFDSSALAWFSKMLVEIITPFPASTK